MTVDPLAARHLVASAHQQARQSWDLACNIKSDYMKWKLMDFHNLGRRETKKRYTNQDQLCYSEKSTNISIYIYVLFVGFPGMQGNFI